MRMFETRESNNWWAPNTKCVEAMLDVVGFRVADVTLSPGGPLPCQPVDGMLRHIFTAVRV